MASAGQVTESSGAGCGRKGSFMILPKMHHLVICNSMTLYLAVEIAAPFQRPCYGASPALW